MEKLQKRGRKAISLVSDGVGQLPRETTMAQLHEVYNLEEIVAIRKGFASQPAREEPIIHDWAKQPGAWDPADILQGYNIFWEAKYIDR